MSPGLLTALTFLAVLMVQAAIYSIVSDLYLRDRSRVNRRVDEEFRKRQRERAGKSVLFKNLGRPSAEALAVDVWKPTLRARFEALVEQSGLDLTPRRLLEIILGAGLILGALAGLIRQSLLAGAIGAVVGAAVPYLYVSFKRKARMRKLMSQLPDTFDLMGRVIRAGQTMAQSLLAVAQEFDPPVAAEFAYCFEQQNLGLPPEFALRDLARRTNVLEIKIFVLALLVQQQTGGNLAELLDKLAKIMRERFHMRGKIAALTAEGRLQAAVLLVLPPLMFLIILFLNPSYGRMLFDYPGLLAGIVVSQLCGALWIRKIVNFDY
jgi:tight adherence protein B